ADAVRRRGRDLLPRLRRPVAGRADRSGSTRRIVAARVTEAIEDGKHTLSKGVAAAAGAKARAAAAEMGATNVEFVDGEAEQLPFPDDSFDVVISSGVIDLIPDKDAVFAELFRVLTPGGRMQIADVTIQNPVSAEGRRNIDLWTG